MANSGHPFDDPRLLRQSAELDRIMDDVKSGKTELPELDEVPVDPVSGPPAPIAPGSSEAEGEAERDVDTEILHELKLIRLGLDALPDRIRDVLGL